MTKQDYPAAKNLVAGQVASHDRSEMVGVRIVERARQDVDERRLSCHGDGPGYNDHSTGGHDKAVP